MFKYLKKAYIMSLASYLGENPGSDNTEQTKNQEVGKNKIDPNNITSYDELTNQILEAQKRLLDTGDKKLAKEISKIIEKRSKEYERIQNLALKEKTEALKVVKESLKLYAMELWDFNKDRLAQKWDKVESLAQEWDSLKESKINDYLSDDNLWEVDYGDYEKNYEEQISPENKEKYESAKEWYRLHWWLKNSRLIKDAIPLLEEAWFSFVSEKTQSWDFTTEFFNAVLKYQQEMWLKTQDWILWEETMNTLTWSLESKESMKEYTLNSYRIQQWDTLWKIAKEKNISLEDIKKLNPWIKANKLRIWQKIYLPKTNEK